MKRSYQQLLKEIKQVTATANKIGKAELKRGKRTFKSKMSEFQSSLHDLVAAGAAAYEGAREGLRNVKWESGKATKKKTKAARSGRGKSSASRKK